MPKNASTKLRNRDYSYTLSASRIRARSLPLGDAHTHTHTHSLSLSLPLSACVRPTTGRLPQVQGYKSMYVNTGKKIKLSQVLPLVMSIEVIRWGRTQKPVKQMPGVSMTRENCLLRTNSGKS
jgi:hypothetical protein